MEKFPTIHTERLTLNRLELTDVDQITQYCSKPEVYRYLLTVPTPYKKEDAIWWVKNSWQKFEDGLQYNFALRKKDSPELIGTIGLIINAQHLKANLGYWLGEEHWNKGYMTEAIKAAIEFSFTKLKLIKVYASHFEGNDGSGAAMKKAGMHKEGYFKAEYYKNGQSINAYKYGIVNDLLIEK